MRKNPSLKLAGQLNGDPSLKWVCLFGLVW